MTQSGTAKAEEMANDLETRVLTAIDEVSPGTIGAIEAECGIRRRKLEKVIKHLHRIGLISSTREHSGSGDE